MLKQTAKQQYSRINMADFDKYIRQSEPDRHIEGALP